MTSIPVSGGSGIDDVTLTDASGNTVDLDGVEVITGSAGEDILTVPLETVLSGVDGGDGADTLILLAMTRCYGGSGSDGLLAATVRM